jgi:hypothetical protein
MQISNNIKPFATKQAKWAWVAENCQKCIFATECRLATVIDTDTPLSYNQAISIGMDNTGGTLLARCIIFEQEPINK